MLNRDFKEFAELLNARGVEYLVVGGYAPVAHGHPRYTGDIDFWVSPAPENIDRLLAVLNAFGFGSLGLSAADFTVVSQQVVQVLRARRLKWRLQVCAPKSGEEHGIDVVHEGSGRETLRPR
jgi:hypothetical protein